MKPLAILETALYVDDLEAAKDFYVNILGLKFHTEKKGRHIFLECGDGVLLLFDPHTTKNGSIPHGAQGAGHVAFKIGDDEFKAWRKKLIDSKIKIEEEVDWPEGSQSIYFRDPAGNSLEFTSPKTWGLKNA